MFFFEISILRIIFPRQSSFCYFGNIFLKKNRFPLESISVPPTVSLITVTGWLVRFEIVRCIGDFIDANDWSICFSFESKRSLPPRKHYLTDDDCSFDSSQSKHTHEKKKKRWNSMVCWSNIVVHRHSSLISWYASLEINHDETAEFRLKYPRLQQLSNSIGNSSFFLHYS